MKSNDLLNGKTVYILDGHGILYQNFHAMTELSSPQGEPVGAVFGLARDVLALVEKHNPDVLLCAFDMHGPTFRADIYEKYKANRSAMPDDLRPQIEFARELVAAMGIPALGIQGFEADDILATVARRVVEQGGDCVLVTSDKDCRQLITDHVSLFNLRKQAFYKAEDLLVDWGIRPDQVVDFQSLVGDATDNIPGVPLIGPKIASELLNKFDTLEGIFEHAQDIPGKKRQENIVTGKDVALMCRELVRLRDDVPVEIDWKSAAFKGFDTEELREIFFRFGFRSLQQKLDNQGAGRAAQRNFRAESPSLFDALDESKTETPNQTAGSGDIAALRPRSFPEKVQYHLVDTEEKFEAFFEELKRQTVFAFDTETAALDARFEATSPRYTVLVGLSFAWKDDEAWYLPLRGPLGAETLDAGKTLGKLRGVLEDPEVGIIGQNLKYDIVVLKNVGVELRGMVFDTMIAHYLLHAGELNHNLDDMAARFLKHETVKITDLIGKGKKQKRMDEVQTDAVAEYAGEDALVVWLLYPMLKTAIEAAPGLDSLLRDLELPLVYVLADMEFTGIGVDTGVLGELSGRFSAKMKLLETEIYKEAGHEFNIASPKQLATVLFDELGLKGVKKTKTGLSTDIEVLEELAGLHPLPAKVAEHRQLAKLKGTYVDALPELIHPTTQRIHTSFNQVATATGRLSSSAPNLQNIPVRTAEGREIRGAFRPGGGFDLLLSCDYSQIELRVLAHFSEDDRLCEAFRNNEDIHDRVAREVFGVESGEVTSDMRRTAKAVNFGVIYGQTSFGLAKQLGIPQEEAQAFIDGYFAKYSQIRFYLDSILEDALHKGFVTTLLGRRRAFAPGTIRELRRGGLNQAERMAINTVIQGSAADLMKQAMDRLDKTLPKTLRANLLLQIHDELVYEVTKKDAAELQRIVTETMTLDQPLRVPLVVDATLGEHWE